jgi:uncharacterized membrane protein YhiD involved in acid resistance
VWMLSALGIATGVYMIRSAVLICLVVTGVSSLILLHEKVQMSQTLNHSRTTARSKTSTAVSSFRPAADIHDFISRIHRSKWYFPAVGLQRHVLTSL